MALSLTPERGLLFRIAHVANLPWLLANGLHCANGATADPNFVAILHDFTRDDGYPDKMERYQAEALAHQHVPPDALLGIGCVSEAVRPAIEARAQAAGRALQVFVRPGWYF